LVFERLGRWTASIGLLECNPDENDVPQRSGENTIKISHFVMEGREYVDELRQTTSSQIEP